MKNKILDILFLIFASVALPNLSNGQIVSVKLLPQQNRIKCGIAQEGDFYSVKSINGRFLTTGYFAIDTSKNAPTFRRIALYDSLGNYIKSVQINSKQNYLELLTLDDGSFYAISENPSFSNSKNQIVQKYNSDLSLDSTYLISTEDVDFSTISHDTRPFTVDKQNNLYIGGYRDLSNNSSPILYKFLPDGKPDISFNKNCPKISQTIVSNTGIKLQSDGKVIVTIANLYDNNTQVVLRLNLDGSLDTSFHIPQFNCNSLSSLFIDSHDRIYVCSPDLRIVDSSIRNSICRLLPNGRLDRGFNPRGGLKFQGSEIVPDLLNFYEFEDGRLFISGRIAGYQDAPIKQYCILNNDGSLWDGYHLPDSISNSYDIFDVAFFEGKKMVVSSVDFYKGDIFPTKISCHLIKFHDKGYLNVPTSYRTDCNLYPTIRIDSMRTRCTNLFRKSLKLDMTGFSRTYSHSWLRLKAPDKSGIIAYDVLDKDKEFLISENGTYLLTVDDNNGCYFESSPLIVDIDLESQELIDTIFFATKKTESCSETRLDFYPISHGRKVLYSASEDGKLVTGTLDDLETRQLTFKVDSVTNIIIQDTLGCRSQVNVDVHPLGIKPKVSLFSPSQTCDTVFLKMDINTEIQPYNISGFEDGAQTFNEIAWQGNFEVKMKPNIPIKIKIVDKNNCEYTIDSSYLDYRVKINQIFAANFDNWKGEGAISLTHFVNDISSIELFIDNKYINSSQSSFIRLGEGEHVFRARWNSELGCRKELNFEIPAPFKGINDTVIYSCNESNGTFKFIAPTIDDQLLAFADSSNPLLVNGGKEMTFKHYPDSTYTLYLSLVTNGSFSAFSKLKIESFPEIKLKQIKKESQRLYVDSSSLYSYSFEWFKNGIRTKGNNASILIDDYSASYELKITNPFGCDSRTLGPIVPITLGVGDVENQEMFNILPNPAKGNVILTGIKPSAKLLIMNIDGRVLHQEEAKVNHLQVDLSLFSSGLYIVQVNGIAKKLVVE